MWPISFQSHATKKTTTHGFVGLLAEIAGQARAVDPLDANMVAKLNVLDEVAFRDYDAGTLVTAN